MKANRTTQQNKQNIILKVDGVCKEYVLGTVTGQTLKDTLRDKWNRKEQVQKHNQRFVALDDVSFEVKKGETVGLIGRNGAGKSTLLKIISRITAPSAGKVYIDGRISSMLEVGTGFHQELTGRENIYLNGSILGMTKAEIDQKIESIIEFSECRDFIDTPVKRYSSGMYVKLAFAVASHLESEIMIMDEVLAVGDLKFQTKCLNKMKEIAETEGRTILYVSHNMDTIHKLCKRCIVLEHGKVAFDGGVDDAVKLYLGESVCTKTTVDYTQYRRPGWLGRDDVRLTWGEYQDQTDNVFTGSEMILYLRWTANSDVETMGVRVELLDNEDRPFATAIFYDCFSGKMGEQGEGVFTVDISNVMNGEYKTIYTLFCVNSYQESVDFDCVKGLDFEIKRERADNKMKWKNASWGNVLLDGNNVKDR